jgi:hypothetical protein
MFGFKSPEVEDQTGPQASQLCQLLSRIVSSYVYTHAACPFSRVPQAPTPSFAPMK